MIHPDTEIRFISDDIGYGVVAKKLIPKGTITWVQDELDQVYTQEEIDKMKLPSQQMIDKYSFRNNKGEYVLCWDFAKYVNHSFKSNCLSTTYDFEIAIRDIHPGEELTDDYGYLNISEAFKPQDEGTERTVVYPDDLLNFYKEWDLQLKDGFSNFNMVDQPLKGLIPESVQVKLKLIQKGELELESIKDLYFDSASK